MYCIFGWSCLDGPGARIREERGDGWRDSSCERLGSDGGFAFASCLDLPCDVVIASTLRKASAMTPGRGTADLGVGGRGANGV